MAITELCLLFQKYNSDKCPHGHTYSPVYYEILNPIKDKIKYILEIGIGSKETMGKNYIPGASLRAWRDFFPNAYIYGADINQEVLFEDDRIKCFYTDQNSEISLEKMINGIKEHGQFDNFNLIIDDGSHIPDHMVKTFKNLWKYIAVGGMYIIEDIKDMSVFESLKTQDSKIKIHYGNARKRGFIRKDDKFILYEKI